MRECSYSTKTREVLGIPSREISRGRSPRGNLEGRGKSLGGARIQCTLKQGGRYLPCFSVQNATMHCLRYLLRSNCNADQTLAAKGQPWNKSTLCWKFQIFERKSYLFFCKFELSWVRKVWLALQFKTFGTWSSDDRLMFCKDPRTSFEWTLWLLGGVGCLPSYPHHLITVFQLGLKSTMPLLPSPELSHSC